MDKVNDPDEQMIIQGLAKAAKSLEDLQQAFKEFALAVAQITLELHDLDFSETWSKKEQAQQDAAAEANFLDQMDIAQDKWRLRQKGKSHV